MDSTKTVVRAPWIDASEQKPKTGQKVLVCGRYENGKRWRTVARWFPAKTLDASQWDDTPGEWWDEKDGQCYYPDAAWWEEPIDDEGIYRVDGVTHWMPLPDYPNAEVSDAGRSPIESTVEANRHSLD